MSSVVPLLNFCLIDVSTEVIEVLTYYVIIVLVLLLCYYGIIVLWSLNPLFFYIARCPSIQCAFICSHYFLFVTVPLNLYMVPLSISFNTFILKSTFVDIITTIPANFYFPLSWSIIFYLFKFPCIFASMICFL